VSERTNADRIQSAEDAIDANQHGSRWRNDDEGALTDILADLMHWAKANNHDFNECARIAKSHFDAEVAEAEEAGE
jgi:hypothetical protein